MAMAESSVDSRNGTSRPVPDPTALTNELVARAVLSLRELMETRLTGIDERVTTAISMIVRHADTVVKQNTEITDEKIKALIDVVSVFKQTVNERFQLGDVQTEKAARDVKSAVDAAFAAAKEAVGEQNKSNALSIAKSETATAKQIDQLVENQRAAAQNTNDKVDALKKDVDDKNADLKDRLTAMESRTVGINQTGVFIVGAFAILASIAAIASLVVHFAK